MTAVKFGSKTSSDDAPPLAVTDDLIHQVSSNDEVERPRDDLWRAADMVEAD
jgi:hypothetical protein